MALDQQTLTKLLSYLELMINRLEEKKDGIEKITSDFDLLFSVEHMLHTAIEAVANISEHIIAGLNLGHPDRTKDSLKILAKNKIISEELSEKLGEAADMRNVLVHEYADIDPEHIIKVIKSGELNDLREFSKEITEFLKKNH